MKGIRPRREGLFLELAGLVPNVDRNAVYQQEPEERVVQQLAGGASTRDPYGRGPAPAGWCGNAARWCSLPPPPFVPGSAVVMCGVLIGIREKVDPAHGINDSGGPGARLCLFQRRRPLARQRGCHTPGRAPHTPAFRCSVANASVRATISSKRERIRAGTRGGSSGGTASSILPAQSQLRRHPLHRLDHELDVLASGPRPSAATAVTHLVAIHSGCERLVLELLHHRLRFQVHHRARRADQCGGGDQAR